MLREELLSGPGEADNIQRGCSTVSMAVSVHMSLEVSAQEKVRSKHRLDGYMRTWQCSAQSNRWVTAHLHSIMTPPRASYLPVPPFPCSSAKFFVPCAPCLAEKKTALQQGRGQVRIVILHCCCQDLANWQTRNRLSSTLWQDK